ncbi:MAG: hypothetical protein ACPG80_03480 [Rickettsiales bacterium]
MSNRIIPSTVIGTSAVTRPKDTANRNKSQSSRKEDYAPPHRAQFNYIPSPEVLKSMIDRALEALSKGIYWDRGSIIDIVL